MMLTTIVVDNREESAMKTISVRIDEELVNAARAAAASEFRTIQGQIEFWAKVGRAALDNPDLPVEFVVDALQSLSTSREDTKPFIPRSAK
jgi:hypothetical protein